MRRHYRFVGEGSDKTWAVERKGRSVTTWWGRTGAAQKTLTKKYPTDTAAINAETAAIRSKTSHGYVFMVPRGDVFFSAEDVLTLDGLAIQKNVQASMAASNQRLREQVKDLIGRLQAATQRADDAEARLMREQRHTNPLAFINVVGEFRARIDQQLGEVEQAVLRLNEYAIGMRKDLTSGRGHLSELEGMMKEAHRARAGANQASS